MADPFPPPKLWRFPLGAVVTWDPRMQQQAERREIGHVTGFSQDDNKLPMIRVRWQGGDTRDVPPGYLATEKDFP